MISDTVLNIDKLSLTISNRLLFQDLSFRLHHGEILAVMGPSGIGKSMLARAIAGFLPSDVKIEGGIKFNNTQVSKLGLLQRTGEQKPAMIFQDALKALNTLTRIEQQLCLALTGNKTRLSAKNKAIVVALLSQLGFAQAEVILSQYPSQLSGGQRQRICIAIALLRQANLIIADEPTSALDPITQAEILSLYFENVRQKNISGILITHDLNAALKCDKLLVIADGAVVALGTPLAALKESAHPFCVQLQGLLPKEKVLERDVA